MEDQKVHKSIPSTPMERPRARTILRRSIYTFLQNYHYFTSTIALLALPFSASVLLSQSFVPPPYSSLFPAIHQRLQTLFHAAGFPPSSELFAILSLKLSQTISSSILSIPFALTFLLFAKSLILTSLCANDRYHKKRVLGLHTSGLPSTISSYTALLHTYIYNTLLVVSANATAFSILFFAFNLLEGLGFSSPNALLLLSAAGAIIYSIILANALVISSLALVLSGVEGQGGYMAILRACVLIRGRTSTALSLAVPMSLAMAGIESLFQFRIVRAYHHQKPSGYWVALEPLFIAYLYSIFLVLDTIVSYMFYKSCKEGSWMDQESRTLCYQSEELEDEEMGKTCADTKNLDQAPLIFMSNL